MSARALAFAASAALLAHAAFFPEPSAPMATQQGAPTVARDDLAEIPAPAAAMNEFLK